MATLIYLPQIKRQNLTKEEEKEEGDGMAANNAKEKQDDDNDQIYILNKNRLINSQYRITNMITINTLLTDNNIDIA